MKHVCKHPPRHVTAGIDYLHSLGAVVGPVRQNKGLQLPFTYCGRRFKISPPLCSGANALQETLFRIRRTLHHAGLPAPQAGAVRA